MGGWYGEDPAAVGDRLHGAVDEVTVLHRELAPGWLESVRANQRDPELTYTVGPPQPK